MPTYGWLARFRADFERLTPSQQAAFLVAVQQFVDDLQGGRGFRNGLISPQLRLDDVQKALGDETSVQLVKLRASSEGLERDREFASRCWDLDSLGIAYRDLSERIYARMADYESSKLSDRDAFIERMRLVHEYRMFPYRDPDLPLELLPNEWPGVRAHAAFSQAHRALRDAAERHYLDTVTGKRDV